MKQKKNLVPVRVVAAAYRKWSEETRYEWWPFGQLEQIFARERRRTRKMPSSRVIAQKFLEASARQERTIGILEREILAYEDMRLELVKLRAATAWLPTSHRGIAATVPAPTAGCAIRV